MSKEAEIRARVDVPVKAKLQQIADSIGEDLSVVLREAVREYIAKRADQGKVQSPVVAETEGGGVERPGAQSTMSSPTSYRQRKRGK